MSKQTLITDGQSLENNFEAWQALSEEEKQAAYSAPGKEVPFSGDFTEHPCFQEAYGFRPNGPNERDTHKHGIYSKDLNGDSLELLTPELAQILRLTVTVQEEGAE